MESTLTELQRRLAEEFFAREQRFVLTGGGALCGYLLGHRTTKDLDLFASEPLLEDGHRALEAAARALGATLESKTLAPDFRRYLVSNGVDSVLVDLVHDRAPKAVAPGLSFGAVRVDPPEEILANKLCTLLSRSELRDLVDVLALEKSGLRVEDALPLAVSKDGAVSPAQLGWVLSQIAIGDDAEIPGGVSVGELRTFLAGLRTRLGLVAWPGQPH